MGESRRERLDGGVWFAASFSIQGSLDLLGNELDIFCDVTDTGNTTFTVLFVVKDAINAAIDRRAAAYKAAVESVENSLLQVLDSFAEIPNFETVRNGSADGPAASGAVKTAEATRLIGCPFIVACGIPAGTF